MSCESRTYVSWSTLVMEFDYCVPWIVSSNIQQCIVKVRWRCGGQKGQIFILNNVNTTVCIVRCSLSSGIRWYILFFYPTYEICSNMHLNCKSYPMVTLTRIQKKYTDRSLADIKKTKGRVLSIAPSPPEWAAGETSSSKNMYFLISFKYDFVLKWSECKLNIY